MAKKEKVTFPERCASVEEFWRVLVDNARIEVDRALDRVQTLHKKYEEALVYAEYKEHVLIALAERAGLKEMSLPVSSGDAADT